MPEGLVRRLTACGTTAQVVDRLLELGDHSNELVLSPFGQDAAGTLAGVAKALL